MEPAFVLAALEEAADAADSVVASYRFDAVVLVLVVVETAVVVVAGGAAEVDSEVGFAHFDRQRV